MDLGVPMPLFEAVSDSDSSPEPEQEFEDPVEQQDPVGPSSVAPALVVAPEVESDDAKLNKLQEELSKDKRQWLIALHGIVGPDVDDILDEESPKYDLAKQAFMNLMSGNLKCFIDNENDQDVKDIAAYFVRLQDLLMIQKTSLIYESLTERDKKQKQKQILPTIESIKLATLNVLEKICKDKSIPLPGFEEVKKRIVLSDNPIFIAEKKYKYDEMVALFDKLISSYDISLANTKNNNVMIHLLLQFAGIQEFPAFCCMDYKHEIKTIGLYGESQPVLSPGFFYIYLYNFDALEKLIRYYNVNYDKQMMDHAERRYENFSSVCVKINTMVDIILSDKFKEFVHQYFSNKTILENYQLFCENKHIAMKTIANAFNHLGAKYKISSENCDFTEAALIYAFGVREKLGEAQYQNSYRFESFATHIDFYLGIPIQDAKNMVTAMNIQFPAAAKFAEANAHLKDKGKADLQVVSIKNSVLMMKEVLLKMEKALEFIAENNPDLMESFQVLCKARKHTTKQLAETLSMLADEYKDNDVKMSDALSTFSLFVSQRKPKEELLAASFQVERAISAHESALQTPAELTLFKQGKKRAIKEAQVELDVRKKMRYL